VLDPREELVHERSFPHYVYFQQEGWAQRFLTTREGARQIVTLLLPGGVCNLDNLMFERAGFGVRMLTKAVVLCLPREQAMDLVAQHSGIGRAFTSLALAENAVLTQWAVCLGRRSAEARFAHLLLEICLRTKTVDPANDGFQLPLTQELLSEVLGLTPVHTNRVLQRLRGLGLVVSKGSWVRILDPDGLSRMAQFDPTYLHQIDQCYEDVAGSGSLSTLLPSDKRRL
jgi:CRP-like cAMP-binding protein